MVYENRKGLILIGMVLLLLTGCATGNPTINQVAICNGLESPLNEHLDSLVEFGESIISVGADEVLVTADTLASAYDSGCDKK